MLLLEVPTSHGPELHLNVSALQRPVLLLEVSTPEGPELIWTCLQYSGLCCSWRCLPTPQGPELLLNVSALLRYVLLLEVSTPKGPELHLNVYALQCLVLLQEVSNPRWPVPTYCWMCSLRFENNFLTVGRVRFALKIIFFLSNVFASLWK